jgi:hypothetical protein
MGAVTVISEPDPPPTTRSPPESPRSSASASASSASASRSVRRAPMPLSTRGRLPVARGACGVTTDARARGRSAGHADVGAGDPREDGTLCDAITDGHSDPCHAPGNEGADVRSVGGVRLELRWHAGAATDRRTGNRARRDSGARDRKPRRA